MKIELMFILVFSRRKSRWVLPRRFLRVQRNNIKIAREKIIKLPMKL